MLLLLHGTITISTPFLLWPSASCMESMAGRTVKISTNDIYVCNDIDITIRGIESNAEVILVFCMTILLFCMRAKFQCFQKHLLNSTQKGFVEMYAIWIILFSYQLFNVCLKNNFPTQIGLLEASPLFTMLHCFQAGVNVPDFIQ